MSISNNSTLPPALAQGQRRSIAAALSLVAVVLWLYRPWVDRPFDTLDFSEFLPFLTGPDSVVGRSTALAHYYIVEHGRLNLVGYLGLAIKWTLLGAHPVLWQWTRVLELGVVVMMVHLFLRRMALGWWAAFGAASIFAIDRVVSEAWTRMTMGEPLGLAAALGALLLATTWRTASRPARRAVGSGLLLVVAVLAKEMLIGVVPLVCLVGLGRRADGRLGRPELGPLAGRQLFWCTALPTAAFLAALIVALGGGSEGFTALYGQDPGHLDALLVLLGRPWEVQGIQPGSSPLTLPGNLIFGLVILAGLWYASRSVADRENAFWSVVAAGGLTLAFALLYLPWPYAFLYYAIPFHLGAVLLFGQGLQTLGGLGPRGRRVALAGWLGVVVAVIPATARSVSLTIALQQLNGEVARALGQVPNADRIVVARPTAPARPWLGTGATLRRYALVTGVASHLPIAVDVDCAGGSELLRRGLGRHVFISYLKMCGPVAPQSVRFTHRFRSTFIGWKGIHFVTDSVMADILFTAAAMRADQGAP